MGFLAVVMAYAMRVCLSMAIVKMVRPDEADPEYEDHTCSFNSTEGDNEHSGGDFDWSDQEQGLILSSFFWGYVITHLPGGLLAEKFGGKHTLGLGILSTAIFTLLTPLAVDIGGKYLLLAVRILEGLGEGTTYPALNALLAQWAPPHERGQIGSLIFAGSQIGTVLGTLLSGVLLKNYDWSSVFYVFGAMGVVWWLLWDLLCYSDPNSHPWISDDEKKYLEDQIGGKRNNDLPQPPFRALLTSVPLWALICAQIGHDWGFFTMVTDLPKYMSQVLKFRIQSNGIVSSIPYVVMWIVSIFAGWLCDWTIKKNYLNITNARKIFTTIASVGPAVFIIWASYAGCDRIMVVVLFTIGMGLMGAFYPGMKVNGLDLSPNYAGTVMAMVNGIGAFTGIITPYLVGLLTPNHTLEEWRVVFWITFVILVGTNVVFALFASGETQWWNDIDAIRKPMNTHFETGLDTQKKSKTKNTTQAVDEHF
ncbi:putative inorganic phosphate cotransporter isoform X2 [Chrysoperla carnea]|nr:putative inorganic phosphate cotransporter isoform X2 [Chrysoperla carnea]